MFEVTTEPFQTAPMEEIRMNTTVLVIGGGWNGIKVASELSIDGYEVVLTESGTSIGAQFSWDHLTSVNQHELSTLLDSVKEHEGIEVLTSTRVISLTGGPGDFHVRLKQDGEVLERDVGAVVVALEAERVPLVGAYRLGEDEKILSQSQLEHAFASAEEKDRLLGDGSKQVCGCQTPCKHAQVRLCAPFHRQPIEHPKLRRCY